MGFKLVCTNCQTSFSVGNDGQDIKNTAKCRTCGKPAHILHHKFKPPKKKDKKHWQIIEFLLQNGLDFSSASVPLIDEKNQFWGNLQVDYPQTLEEAKLFVQNIKPQKSN